MWRQAASLPAVPRRWRSRLLYTAPLAAAADIGLCRIQNDMPDLTTGAMGAADAAAINDDAAAHTGAEGGQNHVPAAAAAALPAFAQRGNVGIVACPHGQTDATGKIFGYVKYVPTQIDTLIHHALAAHGAGNTDTGADDVGLGNAVAV